MTKATRKTVNLTTSLTVDGWMYDGGYFMSGTDAGNVIEKHHFSIRVFLESKASEHLPDRDRNPLTLTNFEGKGSRITLYTITCVREYWAHWAFAENVKAQNIVKVLMSDSLERIFDEVFREEPRSKQEYQQNRDEMLAKLTQSRHECKLVHGGFQLKCVKQKFAPHAVHNRMTLRISGMDAKLARELDMILNGSEDIALDHYQVQHDLALRQLAVAKRVFTYIKKIELSWQEQVDRAVRRAKKEVPV